jgi:septal ring factor EnvC (AmiA/AmiB activator)
MVADERNSLRQQQQEQQEQQARSLLVLQQHKGELLSPVEEDKDVEEEEEHEEEVMTQGSVFPSSSDAIDFASSVASAAAADATAMADRRSKQRKRERTAYLFAAITSSIGFVTLAAGAVYYRFIWQMQVRILSFLSVSRNARQICVG